MKRLERWRRKFLVGCSFVALGVVFLTTVDSGLGSVLIAVGGIWMMGAVKEKKG